MKKHLHIIALQYTGIFSNFQYLMHTGINNDDTGISCVLKITQRPSVVMHIVDFSWENIKDFYFQESEES